jgi:signal transduction histidine kinase/CheY-like chemotaxis protein
MTRRALLWAGCTLAVVGALAGWWLTRPRSPQTWRVGYYSFPPYLIVDETGKPDGFAVQAFAEAAKRRGVAIEWVNTQGSPDKAFEAGAIDLYPLLAITDERRQRLALSPPWWENNLGLVSRRGRTISREALERGEVKVGVLDLSFGATFFAQAFPRPPLVRFKDNGPVAEAVCRGTVDAAMSEARTFQYLRDATPACRGVPLDFRWFRELSLTYAVGAQPAHAREADAFQRELMALAIDGTLTDIGERWNVQATNQMMLFRDLVSVRDRNLVLVWVIGGLAGLVGIVFWQNRRVRLAQQGAEHASRAKNQFLANVSHEIRTPLNGILGMTELLRASELTPSQREFVDALDTSGQSLLTIIADILDYSKIEAGRLTLEEGAVDVADIAEQVVTLFAGRAAEKGLDLAASVAPDVPEGVLGDAGRVRQVLSNLVGNALKFTDRGWVLVSVAVERSPSGEDVLRLSVTDTGPGVPDRSRPRLFQAFTQVDESTRRRHGGTGLGLAICHELVVLMGGSIGVETPEHTGSRFWFTLPLRPATTAGELRPLARGDAALGGQSVLLVADGPATRHAAAAVFASCGARVQVVDTLGAALQPLGALDPPDLVVFETHLRRSASEADRKRFAKATEGRPIVAIRRPGASEAPEAGERSVMWPVRARRLRVAIVESASASAAGRIPKSAAGPLLRARVLVADDNEINRRVVQTMLQKLGCDVVVAADGREAVDAAMEAARTSPFDLVLMDIQMPEVDGLEATRLIRRQEALVRLPIVALTASSLAEQAAACEAAGMNGLLTKPCGLEALRAEIVRWVPAEARRDPSTAA